MPLLLIATVLLLFSATGYYLGQRQALAAAGGARHRLHSLPSYHGLYMALWALLPPAVLLAVWVSLEDVVLQRLVLHTLPDEVSGASGAQRDLLLAQLRSLTGNAFAGAQADPTLRAAADYYAGLRVWSHRLLLVTLGGLTVAGLVYSRRRIAPELRARQHVERAVLGLLILCAAVAVLTTLGIVLSLVLEAARFFSRVPPGEFFLGLQWSPQMAIRAEQVGASGAFGVVPLLTGTLLITGIAMLVALPLGLLSAVFLVEFASPGLRAVAKPLLEVLAGVPTVVYGFFAALTVAPFLSTLGQSLGLGVSMQSALAAGSVVGIMIVPFVSSLSDDVIHAVPQSLRQGALALGATQAETIRAVVLPAALSGVVGAFLLAMSRAIGETMIVLMAAGLYANLTANPLQAVTTITVQIATLLTGDQEFDSAKTLSAFALGLLLFVLTLLMNLAALHVTKRYREHYE